MNINLTLIVQMIVFILLIWFTMRFVWPMILGPMNELESRIAKGLAAGERVVVAGQYRLNNGARITILPAGKTAASG